MSYSVECSAPGAYHGQRAAATRDEAKEIAALFRFRHDVDGTDVVVHLGDEVVAHWKRVAGEWVERADLVLR